MTPKAVVVNDKMLCVTSAKTGLSHKLKREHSTEHWQGVRLFTGLPSFMFGKPQTLEVSNFVEISVDI